MPDQESSPCEAFPDCSNRRRILDDLHVAWYREPFKRDAFTQHIRPQELLIAGKSAPNMVSSAQNNDRHDAMNEGRRALSPRALGEIQKTFLYQQLYAVLTPRG